MIPLAKPGGRKASTRAASVTQSLAVWASQQKYHGTWDVQFANGKLWKPHFSGVFVEFCIGCSGLACVMRWLPEGRGYRNIFDAVPTSDWSEEWGMHPGHNPLSTSINYSNDRHCVNEISILFTSHYYHCCPSIPRWARLLDKKVCCPCGEQVLFPTWTEFLGCTAISSQWPSPCVLRSSSWWNH